MNQLPVLEINNIGKAYRSYRNNFMRFASWFGIKTKAVQETWTLKNINFKLMPGEAVGIIGQNGAGKSTLLKIITGTLQHSTGNVVVRGKIAAILELGMGFHPDLTGRQNAYHAAGLMGYSKAEVDDVIADIEAFAEIGEYFDQPVRLYSSGMQARVAFSVATAFFPNVLIVDEALSVGDAYFQSKCFNKMNILKQSGVSILIVSHDIQAIKSFCDSSVLINKGTLVAQGITKEVAQLYEKIYSDYVELVDKQEEKLNDLNVSGSLVAQQFSNVEFVNAAILVHDIEVNTVETGEDFVLRFIYKVYDTLRDPHYGFRIGDRFGNSVFESNTYCLSADTSLIASNSLVTIDVAFSNILAPGEYIVDVAIVNEGYNRRFFSQSLSMDHNVAQLKVVLKDERYIFAGVCDLNPKICIHKESF